jgi:hypothetical protein
MACFIVSDKGFYKQRSFDVLNRIHTVEWVESLKDAKQVSTRKTANNIIDKLGVPAFIWSPFTEKHVPQKWTISLVTSRWHGNNHDNTPFWEPFKASIAPESDLSVIKKIHQNITDNRILFESEQAALEECIRLNENLIKLFEIKILAQKTQRIELISKPYGI